MADSIEKMIEQRAQQVITRALRLEGTETSSPLRLGSTPGWDSMGHMMVVMELEREFGTTFPTHRLPELVDIPSIVRAVQTAGSR